MLKNASSAHYACQKVNYVSNSLRFLEKYDLGSS